MSQFLYLFRGAKAMDTYSPEEMEVHMGKWKAWMGGLAQQGTLLGGSPLDKGGSVLTAGGSVVTDGPYAEGKEVVGGYIMVEAASLAEAIEISKQCPIFESEDAKLEVREVLGMPA